MLKISIRNGQQRDELIHVSGPLELGRGPQRAGIARRIVQDPSVSRDQLRLEERPDGSIHLENLSQKNSMRLGDSRIVSPGTSLHLPLPVSIGVGESLIELEAADSNVPPPADSLLTIAQPVRARSQLALGSRRLTLGKAPSPEVLAHWFETLMEVQRAATGSQAFYQEAANAVVDLIGLDCGLVLLRRDEQWQVVARAGTHSSLSSEFSNTVLQRIVAERRTFFQTAVAASTADSLRNVEAVVASPIFDARENVIGAIYGMRLPSNGVEKLGIGSLEAQVVQILAAVVGAGLARLEGDAEVSRLRVQFEQFFSEGLARELQRDPRLLEGQEREITVLFSDIRGFSRIAERLGPKDTCQLVAGIMEQLTACVRTYEGVVVDYTGDGLLAMWNAPTDQPDHAVRACRAALDMQAAMPQLSATWQAMLGVPLGLGVGINTGPAMVGNTGSPQKFKYGPLGHTVNVASRVEGATKQLRIPVLATGATVAMLGETFATRRLCRVRVQGVQSPVDLYEVHGEQASREWCEQRAMYQRALELLETGQWLAACRAISPLLAGRDTFDTPSLDLAGRALACLRSPPENFDAVIELSTK